MTNKISGSNLAVGILCFGGFIMSLYDGLPHSAFILLLLSALNFWVAID